MGTALIPGRCEERRRLMKMIRILEAESRLR